MFLRFSSFPWRSISGAAANWRTPLAGSFGSPGLSAPSPGSSVFSISCKPLFCNRASSSSSQDTALRSEIPLSGVEDELVGYIFGKKKATDVAHSSLHLNVNVEEVKWIEFPAKVDSRWDFIIRGLLDPAEWGILVVLDDPVLCHASVWKHVVRRGDTAVDATCGNGYDTLAMLRLVADSSGSGHVFGMDIQKEALVNTEWLLSQSLTPNEKELVKLFPMCHSKMEEVIPRDASVRLVAFNLGYLPGGDKEITTQTETTLLALEAAGRIIEPGGLISAVVYVGHPKGREEFEAVQAFASGLPTEDWICCKLQMLNRPLAPVPIFMFKR